MPRSVQDIIDNADELARRFEQMRPGSGSPALAAVHRAAIAKARAEEELVDAICRARDEGRSWAAIAAFLGTSGEAARQKYSRAAAANRPPAH